MSEADVYDLECFECCGRGWVMRRWERLKAMLADVCPRCNGRRYER